MQAYEGNGGRAPRILYLSTRWVKQSDSLSPHLTSRETVPSVYWAGWWVSRLVPAGNRTGSVGRWVRRLVIVLTALAPDIVVLRLLNYSCVLEWSPSGCSPNFREESTSTEWSRAIRDTAQRKEGRGPFRKRCRLPIPLHTTLQTVQTQTSPEEA